jgi:uncharacterized protein (DUF983 family)
MLNEKCGLCGQRIEFKDSDDLVDDVVQLHAGVGGLVHASCLQESAEAVVDFDREIETRRRA